MAQLPQKMVNKIKGKQKKLTMSKKRKFDEKQLILDEMVKKRLLEEYAHELENQLAKSQFAKEYKQRKRKQEKGELIRKDILLQLWNRRLKEAVAKKKLHTLNSEEWISEVMLTTLKICPFPDEESRRNAFQSLTVCALKSFNQGKGHLSQAEWRNLAFAAVLNSYAQNSLQDTCLLDAEELTEDLYLVACPDCDIHKIRAYQTFLAFHYPCALT